MQLVPRNDLPIRAAARGARIGAIGAPTVRLGDWRHRTDLRSHPCKDLRVGRQINFVVERTVLQEFLDFLAANDGVMLDEPTLSPIVAERPSGWRDEAEWPAQMHFARRCDLPQIRMMRRVDGSHIVDTSARDGLTVPVVEFTPSGDPAGWDEAPVDHGRLWFDTPYGDLTFYDPTYPKWVERLFRWFRSRLVKVSSGFYSTRMLDVPPAFAREWLAQQADDTNPTSIAALDREITRKIK